MPIVKVGPRTSPVGTGSQGGTYFGYGAGWAGLVAEELGISGGAEVTGGPMQNMALVHTGELPFGMTTAGAGGGIDQRHQNRSHRAWR